MYGVFGIWFKIWGKLFQYMYNPLATWVNAIKIYNYGSYDGRPLFCLGLGNLFCTRRCFEAPEH